MRDGNEGRRIGVREKFPLYVGMKDSLGPEEWQMVMKLS